jgi:hypothetical protein
MSVGFNEFMPKEVRACTPSDSTDITGCIGFRVGTAGAVAVKTIHGASGSTAVTIPSVLAGEIIPGNFTRIMSTNTTASGITLFF